MDVIGRTAFGVEADALHNRNDEFYINCREFIASMAIEKSPGLSLSSKLSNIMNNSLKKNNINGNFITLF